MSKCCKCGKWWPHNWLCLKGLYVIFTALFYLSLAYAVLQAVTILRHPALTGGEMWATLGFYVVSDLAAAIGFLTVSKVLKAVRKIKKALQPCRCENESDNHIQTVVEQESK